MVQVNKAPVLPASRRPVTRGTAISSATLPGTSRSVNGLPLAAPAPLATTASMAAVPVVRSPSYTPLHARTRSGSRSAASFTPLPVAAPPSGQQLASWTPTPVSMHQGFTTMPGSLGLEALRARSVTHQQQLEEDKRYNTMPAMQQPPPEEIPKYGPGVDVEIGEHRFRCLDVLGKGSYSEVWRGEVMAGGAGAKEVALKEVRCGNQVELQQAIFEVQVLLALERSGDQGRAAARVPRCISYKVDPCSDGWKVRTAMTVVPGESLDVFIRHKPKPGVTRESAVVRAALLAAKLIRDIGPTLQLLAPIAWHRDVNSHNVLIDGPRSCEVSSEEIETQTSFWLIDFGLAVDSQSWVTMHGRWRTEDIGGDSRYWPPSSWIMHLLGPEGFAGRQELCEQYQTRLDIHGLGVTALELLCTIAQASPESERPEKERQEAWEEVFLSWHRYREDVWRWWAAVYSVFSAGGDIAPVQAQMVRDRVIEQLIVLLSNIRAALRHTAQFEEESIGLVLATIADMIDEGCSFDLSEVPGMLGDGPRGAHSSSQAVTSQTDGLTKVHSNRHLLPEGTVIESRLPGVPRMVPAQSSIQSSRTSPSGRSLSPHKAQERRLGASSSIPARCASPPPPPSVQVISTASGKVPVVVRQLSPMRGRSTGGGSTPGVTQGFAAQARAVSEQPVQTQQIATAQLQGPAMSLRTPRDAQRSFAAPPNSDRAAAGSNVPVEPGVTRYKSTSGIPSNGFFSGGRLINRAQSIEPLRLSAAESASHLGMERSVSPWAGGLGRHLQRSRSLERVGPDLRARSMDRHGSQLSMPPLHPEALQPQGSQSQASLLPMAAPAQTSAWPGVVMPMMVSPQRQAPGQSGSAVGSRHSFGQGIRSGTPQNSPSLSTRQGRQLSVDARNTMQQRVYAGQVLPPAPGEEAQRTLSVDARGTRRNMSIERSSAMLGDGPLLARGSPRQGASAQGDALRIAAAGPASNMVASGSITGPSHLPRMLPTPWLPPPRELMTASKTIRNSGPSLSGGSEEATRLSEAMSGIAMSASPLPPSGSQTPAGGFDSVAASGDGDLSAGPPYPGRPSALSPLRASVSQDSSAGSPIDHVRRGIDSQELLKERMRSLEAHGDEHEKLRERIKNLEESLQKLGRESLERAKLGMEKLAEKYFPKVRPAGVVGPYAAAPAAYTSSLQNLGLPAGHTAMPGLVLPAGASAGVAQVRAAYATAGMPLPATLAMPGAAPAEVSGL